MNFKEIKLLAEKIAELQTLTDEEFGKWLDEERKECIDILGRDIWPSGNSDDVRGYIMLCHYQSLVDEVVKCQE